MPTPGKETDSSSSVPRRRVQQLGLELLPTPGRASSHGWSRPPAKIPLVSTSWSLLLGAFVCPVPSLVAIEATSTGTHVLSSLATPAAASPSVAPAAAASAAAAPATALAAALAASWVGLNTRHPWTGIAGARALWASVRR